MALTHAKRAERREAIAAAVRDGATISAVARQFRVTQCLVRLACREHGINARSHRRSARSMDVLAALLNTDQTLVEIAARFGMHFQQVQQIANDARRAGIRLRRPGYPKAVRA